MRNKLCLITLILGLTLFGKAYSQNELTPVDYKIIAEGNDSNYPEFHVVCYNIYFNQDYLSPEFRNKYNLDDKALYKKKMLIEIFQTDKNKEGLDKINLIGISQNATELVIEYAFVNSDFDNDESQLSPFLIVQVPKSKKKVKFIANGHELGKPTDIYVE